MSNRWVTVAAVTIAVLHYSDGYPVVTMATAWDQSLKMFIPPSGQGWEMPGHTRASPQGDDSRPTPVLHVWVSTSLLQVSFNQISHGQNSEKSLTALSHGLLSGSQQAFGRHHQQHHPNHHPLQNGQWDSWRNVSDRSKTLITGLSSLGHCFLTCEMWAHSAFIVVAVSEPLNMCFSFVSPRAESDRASGCREFI